MTAPHRLEVQTVFTASDSGSHRAAVPGRRSSSRILGVLSLAVAMGWMYATWFPINRAIKRNLMQVGFEHMGPIDLSALFPPPPPELASPAQPREATPDGEPETDRPAGRSQSDRPEPEALEDVALSPDEEPDESADAGKQRIRRLGRATYAWLAITTAVACWLAMAGGAALSGAPHRAVGSRHGPFGRALVGLLATAVVVLDLWFWAHWARYELPEWMSWAGAKPPESAELALVATVLLFSAFLCARIARSRAAAVLAALLLLLAGLAAYSEWGIQIGIPAIAAWTEVLIVFVIASLIGVLLARRAAKLHAIAIPLILLATVATLAAIAYGDAQGGFLDDPPGATTYAKVFAAQSSYAWLLLLARLLRR